MWCCPDRGPGWPWSQLQDPPGVLTVRASHLILHIFCLIPGGAGRSQTQALAVGLGRWHPSWKGSVASVLVPPSTEPLGLDGYTRRSSKCRLSHPRELDCLGGGSPVLPLGRWLLNLPRLGFPTCKMAIVTGSSPARGCEDPAREPREAVSGGKHGLPAVTG